MHVDKNYAIFNSLGVPSIASFFVKIKSRAMIKEAHDFAQKVGLPLCVIGAGTNILPKNFVEAVVINLDFKETQIENDRLKVDAGENWDEAVKFSIEQNFSGIEALSGIPGQAGAAPVQNIGAYGLEIAKCLEEVEIYDKSKKEFKNLNKKDCRFSYRNSLFKENPNKFIITSITLKLSKQKPSIPQYKDVIEYFQSNNNSSPNSKEIREAIIKIRKGKLPDPKILPNAGSYFINPFINGQKISAGKLIDEVGLKGTKIGKIEMYSKNALILTNPQQANFEEIIKAENYIIEKVYQKFGIILKREPQIIG